jgi:prevent-host-death family protein
MKTSSIADAKNNLSHLIQEIEAGDPVHLTRYGKPVAVIISEHQYQNLVAPNKSVTTAIMNWRGKLDENVGDGFDASELTALRKEPIGREFSWEE